MKAIGTSVLGGMITATFLAVFFIPLFFVLVVRVFGRKREGTPAGPAPEAARARRVTDMSRKPIVLAGAALALSGCLMIPKYTRPDLPVPSSCRRQPPPAGALRRRRWRPTCDGRTTSPTRGSVP